MSSAALVSPFRLLDLPSELRDLVYEHTLGYSEAGVYSKCNKRPRSLLLALNKQLHKEVTKVIDIQKPKIASARCPHNRFYLELWDPAQDIDAMCATRGWGDGGMCCERDHDLSNTKSLRIICTNSGSNNPTAVTVHYFPKAAITARLDVFGASQRRQEELVKRFEVIIMAHPRNDSLGEKAGDAIVTEHLIMLRLALHRVGGSS